MQQALDCYFEIRETASKLRATAKDTCSSGCKPSSDSKLSEKTESVESIARLRSASTYLY